ncbi:MAG: DNA gyrase subunit A [Candidatus Abyssobacteria bacterium SURF_17]|uniref:DNA gyrase subunit A n=1 Tax=Candidatus Abyssobacteria bacterium SURF_17 TaxID=2093361 RepID=A0A419EXG5_9BACT|nr:MAG: DNA gyrase subunit A [Candidatus Abyssubacteria bacterium SURF_17]
MYTQNETVIPVNIETEMKKSFIDYAMSVIVSRALPDARDGLKPVHRRILHAMNELGLGSRSAYRKCARIVGDTMGKYHPHGDAPIYDSLVRMAQDFNMRYPLVDGQGNFGSVDGDNAAAMRYTEARLAPMAAEMLADIEKNTVDFQPNFDESLEEPIVLPSAFPNLLVNGSSGIAVGMATNIPPHNLGEVLDALCMLIDNPQVSLGELMQLVKGPDFPTGGVILGTKGIEQAYRTGRGRVVIRAQASIEKPSGAGKEKIVIREIPFQVNKSKLIESIAALAQHKKIEGISDVRDESDKEGMRVVVELKRGEVAEVVLNQLYKHTAMQSSFGVIMLALVDKRPRVLNLKRMLSAYLDHRIEVVTRRTRFDLDKAEERAHILEGLKIALDHIDAVIETIRKSHTPEQARIALMSQFGLTEKQAQAILDMRLQRLTGLEREKIDAEYEDLLKTMANLRSILESPRVLMGVIRSELGEIKKKYADPRRTQILGEAAEFKVEDFIAEEDMVITISHAGYIKRLPVSTYRKQRRGGVGVTGMETKEEDFVEYLFIASTHDYILFFTDRGRVYWLKVHEIPRAGRYSKGRAIINMLQLAEGENVAAFLDVKSFEDGKYVMMVTEKGIVKKTELAAFSNPRTGGIIAISLDQNDKLTQVMLTNGDEEILLGTQQGLAIRFHERQVRPMGRSAMGVIGIRLEEGDRVIGMERVDPNATILVVTENGYGKRTDYDEYRIQNRGGKGIINIKTSERNGRCIGMKTVRENEEVVCVSSKGMVVRAPVREISVIGRNTQGVRVIRLQEDDTFVAVAVVMPKEKEDTFAEESPPAAPDAAEAAEDAGDAEEMAEPETSGPSKPDLP